MKKTALVLMLLIAPVLAEEETKKDDDKKVDPKAIEIVKQTDAAAKAVKAVRFEAVAEFVGEGAPPAPSVKGTGIMVQPENSNPMSLFLGKYLFDVEVTPPGAEKPYRLVIGSNMDMTFLIDYENKKAYEDLDSQVVGRRGGQVIQMFAMIEFVHPAPFSDEMNGESVTLAGTTRIGDEECNEIHITYAGGQQKSHWFFSVKDHLPRRVDRIFSRGDTEAIRRTTITKLEVDPKLSDDMFMMKLPAGFEKVDDFAP